MRERVFIWLVVFGMMVSPCLAGDIMLYSWDQEVSGTAHGRDSGTGASVNGSLREDSNREMGFRFYTKFLGRKFEIGYFTMDNRSVLDATGAFSFNGTDFNVGLPINFQLDANVFEFFPRWSIVSKDGSSLDLLFGIKLFDMQAEVTGTNQATGLAITEELDEMVPVPQIGFHFRIGELKKGLRFEGIYKTLDIKVSDVDVKLQDIQFFAAYRTSEDFDVIVGWRKISNDFTVDEGAADEAGVDIENDGIFFGGRLNF